MGKYLDAICERKDRVFYTKRASLVMIGGHICANAQSLPEQAVTRHQVTFRGVAPSRRFSSSFADVSIASDIMKSLASESSRNANAR